MTLRGGLPVFFQGSQVGDREPQFPAGFQRFDQAVEGAGGVAEQACPGATTGPLRSLSCRWP